MISIHLACAAARSIARQSISQATAFLVRCGFDLNHAARYVLSFMRSLRQGVSA
jgi:hypothetical protein